jgi:hypothetical protein
MFELALVPADDDVDADAAFADVIRGDEFLGRDQRMKQWRVNGAEHRHALGGGEEANRPGDGFERTAVKIGVAAIALPARDRQHESRPASSANFASARQSGQLADHRSGTLVAERPDEQLAPNNPILSALPLYMAMRFCIDALRASTALSPRCLKLSSPRWSQQSRRARSLHARVIVLEQGNWCCRSGLN